MSGDIASSVRQHLQHNLADRGFESEPAVASVTFLGVEPIDVLRFTHDDSSSPESAMVAYATVGCSRHPMGDPMAMVSDPTAGPRAEVVMTLRANESGFPGLHTSLAMVAAAPAVEGLVLTDDALIDLGEPLWLGASFTAVVLSAPDASSEYGIRVPDCGLPTPMSVVQFFTATPVTPTEAAWIRLKGIAALRDAWRRDGTDLADPTRGSAQPAD